jgi:hypothetical protein
VLYAYEAYTLSTWARTRAWPAGAPGSSSAQVRPWELAVLPDRHFPVSAVIADGILAFTTVVLVVLTVLGVGGS